MNNDILRILPKIDDVLKQEAVMAYRGKLPAEVILEAARGAVSAIRETLNGAADKEGLFGEAIALTEKSLQKIYGTRMQRVINATGILIHTNIGRAPVSEGSLRGFAEAMSGYTNLEYDIEHGTRQARGFFAERLICGLIGAEAAFVVNNNAAALLLALNTLSGGKDVLLSRGEVVEIGGSFRLSGIIKASGARLKEVGSTNRTRLSDYEEEIFPYIGAVLKVHTSNFVVRGYTESVPVKDLVKITRYYGIPIIEDMGSGVLTDLTKYSLPYERQAKDAIADGADIITFSGDKLLGGPQAGIIAGKKALVDNIRKNPLARCVRADKAALWMLQETLAEYLKDAPDIPIFNYITTKDTKDTKKKAENLLDLLLQKSGGFDFELIETMAELGGGTVPGTGFKSYGVAISSRELTSSAIEKSLRAAKIPIIARLKDDRVILDIIAIDEKDFELIAEVFR